MKFGNNISGSVWTVNGACFVFVFNGSELVFPQNFHAGEIFGHWQRIENKKLEFYSVFFFNIIF